MITIYRFFPFRKLINDSGTDTLGTFETRDRSSNNEDSNYATSTSQTSANALNVPNKAIDTKSSGPQTVSSTETSNSQSANASTEATDSGVDNVSVQTQSK